MDQRKDQDSWRHKPENHGCVLPLRPKEKENEVISKQSTGNGNRYRQCQN